MLILYIIIGMKKIIIPKGFASIKIVIDNIISNGLSENRTIKKYRKDAIPKIMKKKSALMVHNKINIMKINNNESKNSILIF